MFTIDHHSHFTIQSVLTNPSLDMCITTVTHLKDQLEVDAISKVTRGFKLKTQKINKWGVTLITLLWVK